MMFFRWLKSITFPARTRYPVWTFGESQRLQAYLSVTRLGGQILEDRIVPQAAAVNDFVTQVYTDLLHRTVDSGGLSFWSDAITNGSTYGQVVLDIESSPEFRYDQVGQWYETYLDRTPEVGGLVYWGSQLENDSFEIVQAGILGSNEFYQDAGGTTNGFLNRVYEDVLNRAVDATGESTYGAELNAGMSRTAVAYQILTSPEYREDLVNSFYEQFLHRPADPTGMSFWLNQLSQGTTDQEMIAGIVSSNEYLSRIPNAPVITTPAAALSIEGTTFTIVGTAENGSNVQISSDGSVVGSEQLAANVSNFSIAVPLTANSANNFTVTATNSFGRISPAAIVPTITETPGIITVKAPLTQQDVDGDDITAANDVKVTATDTTSNKLTFSATSLPTGLTINSTTGLITGKIASDADNSSPFKVIVTASDGVNSSSATFAWVVTTTATSTTPLPFTLTDPAWTFLSGSNERIWDVTKGTGTAAAAGSNVTVTLTGYLPDGAIFNPTTTGAQFTLTSPGVIQGFIDGLIGMKVGGERRLDIPSDLGYGADPPPPPSPPGPPAIPKNSELVFDVTLTAVS
jgi:hypothetical protein